MWGKKLGFKYYIRYWLFRLLMFSTTVLPQRFGYWVALRIADLGYFLGDRKGRKAIMKNLRRVFPDESESRLVFESRWVFRNWGKYLCEFFRFSSFDEQFFMRHASFEGVDYVTDALKKGKGCIIMSAHISNWEIGAACLASRYGLPVNVVAARHVYEKIDKMFIMEREAMGIKVIYTDEAGRKVLRALKNNEIVCILSDRDITGGGVEVDFFGHKCKFPQGPERLGLKMGAAMIPGFVSRRTNDSFLVAFREPLVSSEEKSKDEQVRDIAQQFAKHLEGAIRAHPEEWPAFYDVWDEEWVG